MSALVCSFVCSLVSALVSECVAQIVQQKHALRRLNGLKVSSRYNRPLTCVSAEGAAGAAACGPTELRSTGALVMELAPADYLMACVKDTYDFLLSVATIYHTD